MLTAYTSLASVAKYSPFAQKNNICFQIRASIALQQVAIDFEAGRQAHPDAILKTLGITKADALYQLTGALQALYAYYYPVSDLPIGQGSIVLLVLFRIFLQSLTGRSAAQMTVV